MTKLTATKWQSWEANPGLTDPRGHHPRSTSPLDVWVLGKFAEILLLIQKMREDNYSLVPESLGVPGMTETLAVHT